ncbi:Uma2 family endonuclease [Methylomagnum sp.]
MEGLITADELWLRPDDGLRHELIRGGLTSMAPAGSQHGIIALRIAASLHVYVEDHGLGVTFGAETGFKIKSNPDTVRAPDVAFVAKERFEAIGPTPKFWPGAPDLAIEVLSPGDTYSEVQDKVVEWLESGTRLVIVADPRRRVVTVYRSLNEIRMLTENDSLEGGEVVPG